MNSAYVQTTEALTLDCKNPSMMKGLFKLMIPEISGLTLLSLTQGRMLLIKHATYTEIVQYMMQATVFCKHKLEWPVAFSSADVVRYEIKRMVF